MNGFEHEGIFWRPENPGQGVGGRLIFDPQEGVQLNLIGSLGDSTQSFSADDVQQDVILGVAGKKHLTLINCQRQGFTLEAPGIQRERYRAEAILAGHHFTYLDEIVFDEAHITLGNMQQWVGKSPIATSWTVDESKGELVETAATLRPLPTELSIGEDDDVALHFDYSIGGDPLNEFKFRSGCHFRVSTAHPRPLHSIIGDAALLQHLLTLSAGKGVPLDEIELASQDLESETAERKFRLKTVHYYAALPSSWIALEKPIQWHEMIATYQQIGGIDTVHKWLVTARRFDRVLNSLLSIRYAKQIYAENRLQNTIGAAETFHRMKFDNFVMPADEYKTFRRSLVRAVPAAHRNWLSQQLQYSNEPRLRQRLADMAAHAGPPFAELVNQDTEAWVEVVSKVRNRLTHYDEQGNVDVSGSDLYFLSESLLHLLMLCLFVESDVPTQTLTGVLQNQRVRFLQGQLREMIPRLRGALNH